MTLLRRNCTYGNNGVKYLNALRYANFLFKNTSLDDVFLQMEWFIIVRTIHLGIFSGIIQYKKRGFFG